MNKGILHIPTGLYISYVYTDDGVFNQNKFICRLSEKPVAVEDYSVIVEAINNPKYKLHIRPTSLTKPIPANANEFLEVDLPDTFEGIYACCTLK